MNDDIAKICDVVDYRYRQTVRLPPFGSMSDDLGTRDANIAQSDTQMCQMRGIRNGFL